jgi:predicted dehydrogenase
MINLFAEPLDYSGPFPKQSRLLRLGVVGGGRIAGTQAMAARMTGRWEVVAGALSSNPDASKQRGAEWHIPEDRCYGSFIEMSQAEAARSDGVDAVMITTPNHLHYPAACAFLDTGISVLCDKPLTNDTNEANDLVSRTNESKCVFMVSYVMSCFAMVRQAREIVANGGIGKINQIHVEFMQDWMIPKNSGDAPHVKWRLDPTKSGATSCVGDIGTHAAHLASFVSGLKLKELRAEFHVCGSPKPLEDTAFMATRFEGGVPGTLMVTRLAPGNRGGLRLRIFGSDGGLEWDLEHSEYLKYSRFGEPDRILSRGHGHGISPNVERLVRTGRGFPEGLIEAWGNLYTEFALAVACKIDGREVQKDWIMAPTVIEGAEGVDFIEASVWSNNNGGNWCKI